MLNQGHILDGKYKVIGILGKGGMSTVYLCENTRLENLWAIKEVPGNLKYQVDFLTEPNILKKLSHPGIPRIIDIFNESGNLYIVLDYIKGRTLDDIIKKDGLLELGKVCRIAIGICEILEYLHSFDPPIIYRDLKPSNIMIDENGKVVLIDFGISRTYKNEKSEDTVFMGSKGYAAPEQFGNAQSGKQTDVYGLGATLYFMLLGKAPLTISEPLKDESYGGNVTFELREIIKKSMQIEMSKRFEDVASLKKELNNVLIKNSSTKMLNNEAVFPASEQEIAPTEVIKEDNFQKTRFLNISEDTAKTTEVSGYNKTFEKTAVMNHKEEKPVKKKKSYKKYAAAAILILAVLLFAKFISSMNSKDSSKQPETQKIADVKIDDPKTKIENLNRDEVVEGVIYRNSPSISRTLSDSGPDEKKKGKGKKDNDSVGKVNYLLYEVKPQAEVRKYNKNIIFKLERIEVVNDILVTYLTIENNSDKTISITHENNTTLRNSEGKSLNPYTSLSTDLSSIGAGEVKRDVKIVFKGFTLNTDFISLGMNMKIEDPLFTNKAINLKVNVK